GYDRAHGYGDVQVFDLAPIRDGKVKEGDNLKPTATLAIGGDIRGLELSDDASALSVAFTKSQPGYNGKSHPKQYDTADRKIDKEGAKRELLFAGAIWRASHNNYAKFTPDGKHLFVSSFAGRDRSGNMQNPGLDVYVPDQKAESGFKKISSIRSAIRVNSGVS